jgi:hypothetical protein
VPAVVVSPVFTVRTWYLPEAILHLIVEAGAFYTCSFHRDLLPSSVAEGNTAREHREKIRLK